MDYGKIIDDAGKYSDAEDTEKNIDVSVGDTAVVHFALYEEDREVQQKFKGIVIADRGGGMNRSITLRTISQGVGVERVFPINSPMIQKIDILKHGQVSKAKLYHMRDLKGKAATNIQEKKFVPKTKKEE